MVKYVTSYQPGHTFKKDERLTGKKLIDELFKDGSFFYLYPFKVQFLSVDGNRKKPVQILMAVSSKSFPHAVDRNRIRRRMREAYRVNKQELYDSLGRKQVNFLVALIYTGKQSESYDLISMKMKIILKRLAENHAPASKNSE